ncbi:MAG TPA: efflux transporter outer membrane subunit [Verrucomicrobiae bacterium]|nr:efflux transporter outer membrane subunit [Verrucomicrobiae bacterium]
MKINHLSAVALMALLAGGCANIPSVGPDYHAPATKAPAHWSEPLAGGETNAATATTAWWENFHDAELDSLITRAVSSNLDLRIAQSRVREARAQYGGAFADLWPTVNGDGSYNRWRQSQHQPVLGNFAVPSSAFEDNLYQAGFDASWEIDVFGGKRRAVEAAKAQLAGAEFGQRDVLVTLLGEVARNYVDLRGYQKRLAIANQNIDAQEKSLAITQNRFTNGLATDLDVQQAKTVLATTHAEVPTLESAIQTTAHRIEVLIGQQPGTLQSELAEAVPIPAQPPQVPVGLPSELLLRRPDVSRAERQLAAATANIGVAKSDLFPKFYLTGSVGSESISADDWFTSGSRFWSVGPTVQWRIFDAGRIRANIKVKNAQQEQALAAYEQTVLTAFEEVEDNLVLYAKEQVRLRSLQDAVNASQKSLDTANKLYASGLTDFIHVLDAERSLYHAQDALAQSNRTISANLVALYKSLGGGWEIMAQPVALASAQTTK